MTSLSERKLSTTHFHRGGLKNYYLMPFNKLFRLNTSTLVFVWEKNIPSKYIFYPYISVYILTYKTSQTVPRLYISISQKKKHIYIRNIFIWINEESKNIFCHNLVRINWKFYLDSHTNLAKLVPPSVRCLIKLLFSTKYSWKKMDYKAFRYIKLISNEIIFHILATDILTPRHIKYNIFNMHLSCLSLI